MTPILRFTVLAGAVTAGLLVCGAWWTRSAPVGTREAMLWAIGVVFAGSLAGATLLVSGLSGARESRVSGPAGVSRFLAAMLVRMAAVGVGAAAVIVLGGVQIEPFLLWLAVSYLAFLVVDTVFALRVFRSL